MNRTMFLLALQVGLWSGGCSEDPPEVTPVVRLRLARRPAGRVAVEILEAPVQPVALQAELVIDAGSSFDFDDAAAPEGLPLDTVRIQPRGTNRAILFAGDKRGIRLPRAGDVATFTVSGSGGSGTLRMGSIVVAGEGGARLATDRGPDLSIP